MKKIQITSNQLKGLIREMIEQENENLALSSLERFASQHNLTVIPITYRSQGFRIERKGYDLVDENDNVQISIEPKSYAKDKWWVKNYSEKDTLSGNSHFYVSRLSEIPKKLENFIPAKTTGFKFSS